MCHFASGITADLSRISCGLFSPKVSRPSSYACRTIAASTVFETAISLISSGFLPALAAALAIRRFMLSMFCCKSIYVTLIYHHTVMQSGAVQYYFIIQKHVSALTVVFACDNIIVAVIQDVNRLKFCRAVV